MIEIKLRVPSSIEECNRISNLYDCRDCDLRGAPLCQDMVDFLGKKRMEVLEEQENTEIEVLERQVEKLERRVEELERIHYTQPSQPLITQPYPWAPIAHHIQLSLVVVKVFLMWKYSYQKQEMIEE